MRDAGFKSYDTRTLRVPETTSVQSGQTCRAVSFRTLSPHNRGLTQVQTTYTSPRGRRCIYRTILGV